MIVEACYLHVEVMLLLGPSLGSEMSAQIIELLMPECLRIGVARHC
jgi:hypothetical protein